MSHGPSYAPVRASPETFCPACRQPLSAWISETTMEWDAAGMKDHAPAEAKSHRIASGAVLAGRYRIVGPLGQGGMGQVYRADDLTLAQPVALKFFPGPFAGNAALTRLYREVRMARRIAHPNICRVFDILETDGNALISMEFVDGEDLDVLLHRIGRLSPEKALDVAHQICAGLAAAHESGVLHRDLKPANIMLDGRGKVRITDFGLAAQAGEVGAGSSAGTPAYMAPEQIAGRQASVQSDLYALGLVLYEIFTGRRAFERRTSAGVLRTDRRRALLPCNMACLHPAVRQVIWRCLDADPAQRPVSAIQVMGALPMRLGANSGRVEPLEQGFRVRGAAETPQPRLAWFLLGATMVGFALLLILGLDSNGLILGKRPHGPLASVFVWFWFIALQSFLALLSMACLLRAKAKPSRAVSPSGNPMPHDFTGDPG
jgi:hypothetical protein